MPRVLGRISLFGEIVVVGGRERLEPAQRPFGHDAVIADPDVEAAFRDPRANRRVTGQAEALHAFAIQNHVGLADEPAIDTQLSQVIAHRHLTDFQRIEVARSAVGMNVAPCVEAHPARPADGRLHIGIREAHALGRDTVEIRGLQGRMPRAGQVIEPKLVIHHEQDVLRLGHGAGILSACVTPWVRSS